MQSGSVNELIFCYIPLQTPNASANPMVCLVVGFRPPKKWGIKLPPTPFLANLTPRVVSYHLVVVLSHLLGPGLFPKKGFFIPPTGQGGGGITPLGWF